MTREILLTLATFVLTCATQAQEITSAAESNTATTTQLSNDNDDKYKWEFWWGGGFDLASNYMWRGFDQSYRGGNRTMLDPSLQPSVAFGYGKFYVEFWGNASLISDYKEFDIFLGFEHENLLITLYDVFCGVGSDFNKPFFDKRMTNHSLTATIDYTLFDRLRLHWATTFLHPDDYIETGKRAGKRAFSSYFEIAYTQPVKDLFDIEISAGASPWTAPFWCFENDMESVAKGFNVTNLSVMFNREFEIGNVALPVQLGYIYNPTTRYHYAMLIAGFSF